MGCSKITEHPCCTGSPLVPKKTPRKKTRGKKTTAEENDLLNASKKTQPKKTPIFKPADLPHFQNGDDSLVMAPKLQPIPQFYDRRRCRSPKRLRLFTIGWGKQTRNCAYLGRSKDANIGGDSCGRVGSWLRDAVVYELS